MSSLSSASSLLRDLASPWRPGESVKGAIYRVARKLPSWSPRKVKSVWYCEERTTVTADEFRELEQAAKGQSGATNDLDKLRNRLARLEAALLSKDAEFFGPSIDALRNSLGRMGGED